MERGAHSGTHSKSEHVGAINTGVLRGMKRMSSLNGTRDHSLDTDDKLSGYNDMDDEADEYVFDPLELLENDLLDKDLDQPCNSKAIRDPSGMEMINPIRISHPKGSDW
ncbi:hypothetical protein NDU88_005104 [Pleurodeles waltl]|uniref:Uncharacterized protein n=1 Tax=Pleurodeles waltl TaxID=8319 RepID=A0AAV7QJT2_PLEWA|nr:hypothetical protein NDU88_005104 [Pleurodeles waltl]